MTKQMTAEKSAAVDAKNIALIAKLRSSSTQFAFIVSRNSKGLFTVGLSLWHKNDTRRLDGSYAHLASFFRAADAKAYETIITT